MYHPTFDEFCEKARQGNLIPVYREIFADLETPVSAFLKIDDGQYSYLLESVEGGEKWARYCFLGSHPSIIFKSKGDRVEILRSGGEREVREGQDPLEALKTLMTEYKPVLIEGLPRFFGGAVGYLSYDMVRFFEKLPELTRDDLQLPDSQFMITDTILIFDNTTQKIKVVSNAHVSDGNLKEAYESAKQKIDEIIEKLRQPVPQQAEATLPRKSLQFTSNFSQEEYEEAVKKIKEYIRAGDAFQVVPSRRLSARFDLNPFQVYRALRTVNPSPYMYFLRFGDLRIVGSSPEVLVRLEGRRVELRPIAGTRRRGRSEEEDRQLAEELLGDPKERAEHIMLVDLGRNDIGRVCKIGTVEVNELMVIENYSHVMHIVSNVRGELAEGKDAYALLRACFPAGTLSGAPKVRAMEIIEELEPTRRGPYGGAVGYFSFSGNMDTCITIRTLVVNGEIAYLQAGGGIVADSIPSEEYQETANKMQAVIRAIEIAEKELGA